MDIDGKNIEKCPSILYFAPENIRQNWSFLKERNIRTSSVETCLHILSTEPVELEETYEYIEINYGNRYLNANTSILRVSVDRIKELEKKLVGVKKKTFLQAAISRFSIEECVKIVEVCNKHGIEVTGSVFRQSAEEIEKIVGVCNKNGIEVTGNVFLKSAEEIERIVEVCNKHGIEIIGSVFRQSAEEIEKIVEICNKNRIGVTGSIFLKNAKQLEDSIYYVKQNFGVEYVTPLIVSKSKKTLEKVLPFLQEKGVLPIVISSASILGFTKEEIEERMEYLERHKKPIIIQNKKGQAFNSVFGLSRKKYRELVEKDKLENGEITE